MKYKLKLDKFALLYYLFYIFIYFLKPNLVEKLCRGIFFLYIWYSSSACPRRPLPPVVLSHLIYSCQPVNGRVQSIPFSLRASSLSFLSPCSLTVPLSASDHVIDLSVFLALYFSSSSPHSFFFWRPLYLTLTHSSPPSFSS